MIWTAYREIENAEKLLADMREARERGRFGIDKSAPTIRDAFGRARHFSLGILSGEKSRQLFDVSPSLAESVIRAHIENKRAELATANERARIELGASA